MVKYADQRVERRRDAALASTDVKSGFGSLQRDAKATGRVPTPKPNMWRQEPDEKERRKGRKNRTSVFASLANHVSFRRLNDDRLSVVRLVSAAAVAADAGDSEVDDDVLLVHLGGAGRVGAPAQAVMEWQGAAAAAVAGVSGEHDVNDDEQFDGVAAAAAGPPYEELDTECDDDDDDGYLRAILWPIFVAMIAITLVAFLFWLLDRSKRRQKRLADERRSALVARRQAEAAAIDALVTHSSDQLDQQRQQLNDSRAKAVSELNSGEVERYEWKTISADQTDRKDKAASSDDADGSKVYTFVKEVKSSESTLRNRFAPSRTDESVTDSRDSAQFLNDLNSEGQLVLNALATAAVSRDDANAFKSDSSAPGNQYTTDYYYKEDRSHDYGPGRLGQDSTTGTAAANALSDSTSATSRIVIQNSTNAWHSGHDSEASKDDGPDASRTTVVSSVVTTYTNTAPKLVYDNDSLEPKTAMTSTSAEDSKSEAKNDTAKSSSETYVSVVKTVINSEQGNEQQQSSPAQNRGVHVVSVHNVEQLVDSADSIPDEPEPDQVPEIIIKKPSILQVLGASTAKEAVRKMDTLEAVSDVMRRAGLETSNLIFGIDYTASNKYQGEKSFGGASLHMIRTGRLNPYQQVISILGETLAPFASSGFIAAFGFGDVKTSDHSVFSLKANGYCKDFAEVLQLYNEITPKVILSGPTNFAPLIYEAIEICKQVGDYHILVIVADGQVTNEKATMRAIVDACKFPLSIIVVGVGDGPWEMMRVFDESLPKRAWDNFHFLEFHKIFQQGQQLPHVAFAVDSLIEIPDQYKMIKKLGLLQQKN